MKKIIVATLFKVPNYGTALQAYATQKTLSKMGYENEILNYKPSRIKTRNIVKNSFKKDKNLKTKVYRILSVLYRLIPNLIIIKRFEKFIKNNVKLTKHKFESIEEIRNNLPEANVFITGSDQVWNSNYNNGIDYVYYLDFVPEQIKKISYAASIGMEEFKEEEKDEIKQLLKRYNHISVREKSAKDVLNKLEINSEIVLDPTLLLTKEDWQNEQNKRLVKEKYLLLYILGRDKKLVQYAEKIAKEKNLKIVKVGLDFIYSNKIKKSYSFATCNQFINLFLHADYIVTNSFHGLAFSINFNKQFTIVLPNTYSTRLISALEVFNLENRLVSNINNLTEVLKEIDYKEINIKLTDLRKKSIDFLKSSIEE